MRVPLSGSGSATNLGATQQREKSDDQQQLLPVDEHGMESLGVQARAKVASSRREIEYNPDATESQFTPFVIITKDTAHRSVRRRARRSARRFTMAPIRRPSSSASSTTCSARGSIGTN